MNKLKFLDLCDIFEKISQTKKRLEIQSILSNFYAEVLKSDPSSLIPTLYLSTASFLPEYKSRELGVGETQLIKLVSISTNKSIKSIKDELKKIGDLGVIASKYKATQLKFVTKKILTVKKIHSELIEISEEEGAKSTDAKMRRMMNLISNCDGVEIKYLIRIFEGKLKIGLALKTVIISLAHSTTEKKSDLNESANNLKFAYSCKPVFELLIPPLLKNGPKKIHEIIKIEPGIPLKPMLAQPTKNITAAFKRTENKTFTCEYKYDGERAQIHKFGNIYKVYSRNSEDLTERYPDLKEPLKNICKNNFDFILDCEVVAYDLKNDSILPFQILATRKRKNVKITEIKVNICMYSFDILYFKNESLINKSLKERREILFNEFERNLNGFKFVDYLDCKTAEEIENYFQKAISDKCEGIMIKTLENNSEYFPSRRCYNWIKLKKDYLKGMIDTLDLVVLGCYYGKGKRTGTFGGFLMGCYNDEENKFETICKLGTGFDDASLINFYEKLKDSVKESPSDDVIFKDGVKPDVWVDPSLIWEIQAAGFSLSPIYSAGWKSLNQGLSLRFPRFVRVREDKNVEDSTTSSQIVRMYHLMAEDKDDDSNEDY